MIKVAQLWYLKEELHISKLSLQKFRDVFKQMQEIEFGMNTDEMT